ncbi:hypothetical protein F5Y12DRAFT_715504 [Xylaria sp. FL1777]|nr:hypothetical protein F5Y12DRAFT_715504 [Xylaria sp. FL1777]
MLSGRLTDAVRRKVSGGRNRDRLFHGTELEFLVFVSSVNCMLGNMDQASYVVANIYLCSLVAQHRLPGTSCGCRKRTGVNRSAKPVTPEGWNRHMGPSR